MRVCLSSLKEKGNCQQDVGKEKQHYYFATLIKGALLEETQELRTGETIPVELFAHQGLKNTGLVCVKHKLPVKKSPQAVFCYTKESDPHVQQLQE